MRDRPFIAAGEPPRPYSEIRTERELQDARAMQRRALIDRVARLEDEARHAGDPAQRKTLQLQAEEIRCRLHHEG